MLLDGLYFGPRLDLFVFGAGLEHLLLLEVIRTFLDITKLFF